MPLRLSVRRTYCTSQRFFILAWGCSSFHLPLFMLLLSNLFNLIYVDTRNFFTVSNSLINALFFRFWLVAFLDQSDAFSFSSLFYSWLVTLFTNQTHSPFLYKHNRIALSSFWWFLMMSVRWKVFEEWTRFLKLSEKNVKKLLFTGVLRVNVKNIKIKIKLLHYIAVWFASTKKP